MTEIPEHLLQRSRERRAAMGGGDTDAPAGDAPAQESSAAPAKAAAPAAPSMPAHPAPAEPEPPKPDSPVVAAAKKRRKIPYWAMPVMAALPVWAYVFVGTLEAPPRETPQSIGTALYETNCASCHGGGGGGGIGPAFTSGAIFETWPDFEDHFHWVELGGAGYAAAENTSTYGANEKPINGNGMPGFGESLTDAELVYIVLHERELGGENPDPEDHARLAAIADLMFEDETLTLFGDEESGTPGAIELLDEMINSGQINLADYAAE